MVVNIEKKEMREIISANPNLRDRLEKDPYIWSFHYNKKADMLVVGEKFPVGSFYHYIPNNSGVMLRVDKNKKIYGFAIENTKFFMKKNPEVGFYLSLIVYPKRTQILFTILSIFLHTVRGLNKIRAILPVTDYVTRRLAHAV